MIGCEIIQCNFLNGFRCSYPDNQCVHQNVNGYGINDLLREICDLRANLNTAKLQVEELKTKLKKAKAEATMHRNAYEVLRKSKGI